MLTTNDLSYCTMAFGYEINVDNVLGSLGMNTIAGEGVRLLSIELKRRLGLMGYIFVASDESVASFLVLWFES